MSLSKGTDSETNSEFFDYNKFDMKRFILCLFEFDPLFDKHIQNWMVILEKKFFRKKNHHVAFGQWNSIRGLLINIEK